MWEKKRIRYVFTVQFLHLNIRYAYCVLNDTMHSCTYYYTGNNAVYQQLYVTSLKKWLFCWGHGPHNHWGPDPTCQNSGGVRIPLDPTTIFGQ